MFGLFKKKEKKPPKPQLADLDDNPLKVGDIVTSFRYDLGKCRIIEEDGIFMYQSLDSDKKVSWLKMIDASTDRQKVRKVEEDQ